MEYEVRLTQQELQVIYAGLGELPLKVTLNMFSKLQQTQQKQDAEKAVPMESLWVGETAMDPDLHHAVTGK